MMMRTSSWKISTITAAGLPRLISLSYRRIYVCLPNSKLITLYPWCSYVDADGKQLVLSGEDNAVELAGSEIVITKRSNNGTSTKTIGSREFLRYYRQKPRPTPVNDMAISASLASRSASSNPLPHNRPSIYILSLEKKRKR